MFKTVFCLCQNFKLIIDKNYVIIKLFEFQQTFELKKI